MAVQAAPRSLEADVLLGRRLGAGHPDEGIVLDRDRQLRGRACFEFLGNDNLLDLIEGLVGPEITCSPIQHVRPKLPVGLTPSGSDAHEVPWHQDAGVTWEEADPYFILTVWLPLVPATVEKGCLEIIPRTHGRGLWQHHSKRGVGTTIVDEAMPQEEGVIRSEEHHV